MPTYQYACTNEACGVNFERVQSFTDAAITDCPECAGRVRKVYGSVGVVFKGSGFYRTDSRNGSASGAAGSSDSAGSASASNGSGAAADKTSNGKPATPSAPSKSESSSTSSGSKTTTPSAAAS